MANQRPPKISEEILQSLSLTADPQYAGPEDKYSSYGWPPFGISSLAEKLQADPSNLRKKLAKMVALGLVTVEIADVDVYSGIAKGYIERKCQCYWNAATEAEDKRFMTQYREKLDAEPKKPLFSGV